MRAAQGEGGKRGREALPPCSQPRVALEVGVILFRPLSVVLAPRAEVATPALAVVVLIVDVEVVPCQASFIPALPLLFDPTAAHEGRLWIVARRVFTCGRGVRACRETSEGGGGLRACRETSGGGGHQQRPGPGLRPPAVVSGPPVCPVLAATSCSRGCDNDFQRRQQPCQFRKLSRANWHTSRPR
jgi:hypothetical protein